MVLDQSPTAIFLKGSIYTPSPPTARISCHPRNSHSLSFTLLLLTLLKVTLDLRIEKEQKLGFESLHIISSKLWHKISSISIFYSWSLAPRRLEVLKELPIHVVSPWEVCITRSLQGEVFSGKLSKILVIAQVRKGLKETLVLCGLLNGDVESFVSLNFGNKLCLLSLLLSAYFILACVEDLKFP